MCIEISKDGMKIICMEFPYRKKLGLGIHDIHDNAIYKVATFNNEESAEEFMKYLAKFVGAECKKEFPDWCNEDSRCLDGECPYYIEDGCKLTGDKE